MSVLCGGLRREVRYDLETGSAAESFSAFGKLAGTIRDIVLIALAWAIFIGVILYPVTQIIGILVCSIALLIGSMRTAARRSAEI